MAPKLKYYVPYENWQWKHCDSRGLTDDQLNELLQPSFDLRNRPPVKPNPDNTWSARDRVHMTMAWADKMEEESYNNILETWTYDEKVFSKIVAGPRRWFPKAKGQKRQITEEMRTWKQFTFGEILVNVEENIWEPIVLGCPAGSLFSSTFFEVTNNKEKEKESWKAKTKSLYATLEIGSKDSGRSEGGYAAHSMQPSTAFASSDVRNPQYTP